MVAPTAEIICPRCFYAFPPHKLHFRCVAPTCTGREKDMLYAEASGYGITMMGRVLLPRKRGFMLRVPQEAACDACGCISRTRLCPDCHFELPHDVGQIDQRSIAIIGGRATGKTHYIASLITRLQHEVGRNFDLAVRLLGDHTQERWERDFYTPLFVDKRVLQPNRPAEVDPQVKTPLIFRLTFDDGRYKRALNLSFFDSAGEDMTSLNTMSLQNRYILHAHGIIFLLDPLQIPSMRQKLPKANVPPVDPQASPEYIVGRLRDLFERENNVRATHKIKVPVAFTLSKVDTMFSLLDPGSALHHPGGHSGYLDLDDVESVHTEIANYLAAWISPNFCDIIHNNFAHYRFFGVSSLGEQPDLDNCLSHVSPLRIEDPFLWILFRLRLVRGVTRRK